MGFGLHWWYNHGPIEFKSQASYTSAMTDLLQNITAAGRTRLVAHRETSAQHFDVPGGDYSVWYVATRCNGGGGGAVDVGHDV